MKELSIEEKARNYDEAYKKVAIRFGSNVADEIFPELKESEDERIRKELIQFFSDKDEEDYEGLHPRVEIIAWLEKQGEQKPVDKVEPKFKAGDRVIGIVSGMQYYITEVCDDYYYTESGCTIMFYAQDNFELYKQKLIWSEKDQKIWEEISDILWEGYKQTCSKFSWDDIRNWLKPKIEFFKCRVQPKQEWSEQEQVRINRIVACLENLNVADNDILLKDVAWLKSLKDRFVPQSKQEWSEEDEKMLNQIIKDYERGNKSWLKGQGSLPFGNRIKWLKSLRPQNAWKPSEEQINYFSKHIEYERKWNSYHALNVLSELLEQLKKLKG